MVPDLRLYYDSDCGLGHVMRCRTLQKAWNRLGGACKHGQVEPRPHEIVVFDGYCFTNEEKHKAVQDGNIVVTLTEFRDPVVSHIVINHNLGAEQFAYPLNEVKLLGTDYFLLRDEIRNAKPWSGNEIFDVESVGRSLSPVEFANRLAGAKAVICSSGITAYESIYLGKPTFLRMEAENQKLSHTMLIKNKWAYPATRSNLAGVYMGMHFNRPKPKTLVDGNGADRVAKAIYEYWKNKQAKS